MNQTVNYGGAKLQEFAGRVLDEEDITNKLRDSTRKNEGIVLGRMEFEDDIIVVVPYGLHLRRDPEERVLFFTFHQAYAGKYSLQYYSGFPSPISYGGFIERRPNEEELRVRIDECLLNSQSPERVDLSEIPTSFL